jgi:hypothetical protein
MIQFFLERDQGHDQYERKMNLKVYDQYYFNCVEPLSFT